MTPEQSAHVRSTIRGLLTGTDDPMLRADVLNEAYYAVRDNYKAGFGEGEGLDGMNGPERRALGKIGTLIIEHHDRHSRASLRDQVRLSVTTLDQENPGRPGDLLLDVIEEESVVADRAIAWAQAQGYDRLVPALERNLRGPTPESRFIAVINVPHSLLMLATWPGAAQPHAVPGEPATEWPTNDR